MIGAVVLAAGAATRYGAPKQRELLPAVLTALEGIEPVVVVQGAYELEAPNARVVDCANWQDGPGASLRCGLAALPQDVTHALVVLADGPNLDPRAVRRVLDNRAAGAIVTASYDGNRSHPVVLERSVWGDIPDEGARALAPVLVDCSDLTPPGDVDFRAEF
jgi:CTP:molybdopterin cytidylyltransferase MocA